MKKAAYVTVVEQPASKGLRFRYECEGRSAGSIPGASSTLENRTFPTIQVSGYEGRAVVVVSCVTNEAPYRPHPHNLVGKEGCKKGVCTMELTEAMHCSFPNLGIQCVKKKDIEESTRDIVKKAALAVGSLKETEFDIRYVIFQQNFLLTIRWYLNKINNKQSNVRLIMISHL